MRTQSDADTLIFCLANVYCIRSLFDNQVENIMVKFIGIVVIVSL